MAGLQKYPWIYVIAVGKSFTGDVWSGGARALAVQHWCILGVKQQYVHIHVCDRLGLP